MKVEKIVESIMEETGTTKAQLGRAVGIEQNKRPCDVISKRMKQKNISVNVLSEMLGAMGYTMVIVPKGPNLKKGEYEVSIDE